MKRPFQRLDSRAWQNLLLVALCGFYGALILYEIVKGNTFASLGADHLAFWGAGFIARTAGFENAYDLTQLRRVQAPYIPPPPDPSWVFVPLPAAVLPVFLLPFEILSLLSPPVSLAIWTLLNGLGLFFYLRCWVWEANPEAPAGRTAALLMASFPVFTTLFWGQVNALLAIFVGEFLRAMRSGKPLRAGLWLGGLWLKPQTFLLIVPALLLQRQGWALLGFGAMSLLLLGLSLLIAGPQAMLRLLSLWLAFAEGIPTNIPENMVNWRMLGLRLGEFLPPAWAWGIAGTGLTLTALAALWLWRRPVAPSTQEFTVALLGTLAATGVIAWHSHLHQMLLLLPVLTFLIARRDAPPGAFVSLLLLSPFAMLGDALIVLMIRAGILPPLVRPDGLVTSLAGLGLNLWFLGWALQRLRREGRG
ncbi:MAG: glycosyltransferase family 87 protein [Anaerolineae bacterium]|nr:DUF2029 domain-containing protein [Anaerolineae bacterium]MCX8068098.1 DUF2029 domain-containing protein [Anaerolineae bacterium]MDW7992492.1 glycosyltransferase family 87 protein [Anaerolineae bacterium]